jgi:hypothetical protein
LLVKVFDQAWCLHQDEQLDGNDGWLLGRCIVETVPG